MKKLLMIAYHYPPSAGSSGIQRTLKFTQYLPEFGWQPILLTVNPRAYVDVNASQLDEIPGDMVLHRSIALDSARHLSINGKFPGFLAWPDRWSSWILSGVPAGMYLIKKYRPHALFSTYPIASAHTIGWLLAKFSGLPWLADFRDAMIEDDYPEDANQRRVCSILESRIVPLAKKNIFTTCGSLDMYSQRYPAIPRNRFAIIENAFDEENFAAAEEHLSTSAARKSEPITLLHSGLLYPGYRDPRPFFQAISTISRRDDLKYLNFKVILRATGHDELHRKSIEDAGIGHIVELAPPIPYQAALSEMLETDVLLLFQASSCNHQIPAKLYEYFRAKRPILALTDPAGDTAEALNRARVGCVIPIDNHEAIAAMLPPFLASVRDRTATYATDELLAKNTRRVRTQLLSEILNEVTPT